MRKGLAYIVAAALPLSVGFGLDGYISLSLMDRYYDRFINDSSMSRVKTEVIVGGKVNSFGLEARIINYYGVGVNFGRLLYSERVGIEVGGYFEVDNFSLELRNTLWDGVEMYDEVRVLFYYFSSTDLITVSPRMCVSYDFRGLSVDLSIAASVSVPTTPIITLNIPVSLSGIFGNYREVLFSGVSGITLSPRISLYWKEVDLSIEGGYFFGLNQLFSSYPYVSLKVGVEL